MDDIENNKEIDIPQFDGGNDTEDEKPSKSFRNSVNLMWSPYLI